MATAFEIDSGALLGSEIILIFHIRLKPYFHLLDDALQSCSCIKILKGIGQILFKLGIKCSYFLALENSVACKPRS